MQEPREMQHRLELTYMTRGLSFDVFTTSEKWTQLYHFRAFMRNSSTAELRAMKPTANKQGFLSLWHTNSKDHASLIPSRNQGFQNKSRKESLDRQDNSCKRITNSLSPCVIKSGKAIEFSTD